MTSRTKKATAHTAKANHRVYEQVDFDDRQDFEDAGRGFIAGLPDDVVRAPDGTELLRLNDFRVDPHQMAPPTTNPSLWRAASLNSFSGLFKVTEGIYQIRNIDLANMTIIEGDTGIIVIDTLSNAPAARAALDLYFTHRGQKRTAAVIYTHSHNDHFGGVSGIITADDVAEGDTIIVAPAGFTEEALKESLYAGTAMARRATYQYALTLPHGPGPDQTLGTGPGIPFPLYPPTFIEPTDWVTETGQTMVIDGVPMEFIMAPGSEAPAEMLIYFPDHKAICAADEVLHTLHNLYTLRGTKTRDALLWVRYLGEVLDRWCDDAEVMFIQHQWPVWGNVQVRRFLTDYRDVLKFIHDRTLHLANRGHTLAEMGDLVELPPELATLWATRGHYGTVSHNARAVYNFYLGYFSGNPAELDPLPPTSAAPRYVALMGGDTAVLDHARLAYDDGEYRWAAELLQHLVYADPDNTEARHLQADAFEQLGYQSEAGTWRNFYHVGAKELREGVPDLGLFGPTPDALSPDVPLDIVLDYLGIAIDSDRAAGMAVTVNLDATDTGEQRGLVLRRQVLTAAPRPSLEPDASVIGDRADVCAFLLGDDPEKLLTTGQVRIDGDTDAVLRLLSLRTRFPLFFPIVTRPTCASEAK
ncbi:alkyl sulfatase YjcS [soil metagenome]